MRIYGVCLLVQEHTRPAFSCLCCCRCSYCKAVVTGIVMGSPASHPSHTVHREEARSSWLVIQSPRNAGVSSILQSLVSPSLFSLSVSSAFICGFMTSVNTPTTYCMASRGQGLERAVMYTRLLKHSQLQIRASPAPLIPSPPAVKTCPPRNPGSLSSFQSPAPTDIQEGRGDALAFHAACNKVFN